MPLSRSLFLLLIALMLLGCASSAKPAVRAASAARVDPKLNAAQNIEQLANREIASSKAVFHKTETVAKAIPLPPGVEPAVLAQRETGDAKAGMTLEEVLAQFAQRPAGAAAPADPNAPVNPEYRLEAQKLYAKARHAAMDGRTLQAIVELQKAYALDPTSPEILRELARNYLSENRTSQAVEVYEKLIQFEPENLDALFALGLASANRRDFERSVGVLARLQSIDATTQRDAATDILIHFTLATALRELGYDRASIHAALLTVELPNNLLNSDHAARLASVYRQRGEMWRAIGEAHCRLGEYEHALSAFTAAAALPTADPSSLIPRIIYANLCLGRPFGAQHALLRGLTSDSQQPSISDRDIRLCAYLRQNAQPVNVLADAINDMRRQHPDDSSTVRAASALLPPEQARVLLREFVARKPRDLDGVEQLFAWVAQSDVEAAADLAVTLAGEHPDLADAYADRLVLAVPQPAALLSAVRSLPLSVAQARLETKLLWKAGGVGEAWHTVAKARERWPDDRGLAMQQLQLEAVMQEVSLFEKTLASTTGLDDVPSLVGLSQARRALGQMNLAVELAQQALALEPQNADALIELSRAYIARAASLASDESARAEARLAIDEAVKFAEQAIDIAPQRDEAYEVLALVYMPGGVMADTQLYRDAKQRLREANPQSALYGRLFAQESIAQQRYEQAVDRLVSVYESNPADTASLTLAVTAWHQWGKVESAEQWLNQRLAQRPGDAALLEQWVRVQLLLNRTDAVIKRLQADLKSNPNDFLARRLLETVYRATKQIDSAMELGEQRLLSRPAGVRREVELAALYAGAERASRSLERLEWIRDHASDATSDELTGAIHVLSRIQGQDARRDALSLELVNQTIARHPQAPLQVYGSALRALAAMSAVDERFDSLADRAAVNAKGATEPTVQSADQWRELAQALIDDGHPAAAARAVRARLRGNAPLDRDALGLLLQTTVISDAAAESKDSSLDHAARSIQLLRTLDEQNKLSSIVDDSNRDSLAKALYEVSVFYTLIGSRSGADDLLRESIRLDPNHAMALNNYGYSQLESGRGDAEVVTFIERAFALTPDEPNILDTVGWLRYKQGRLNDEPGRNDEKPVAGALSLIEQAIAVNTDPSAEVFDHLGDVHWRLGHRNDAIEAWRQVVKLLDDSDYRKYITQNLQMLQTRGWRLLVLDPNTMYDREFGPILERARQKLAAVDAGQQPQVAPTFEELR